MNHEDLRADIYALIDLNKKGADDVTFLKARMNLFENILFHLINRERNNLANETRSNSLHDRDLAYLLDALKSEITVTSAREQESTTDS